MRSNHVPNLNEYSAPYRWTTLREESSYTKHDLKKNAHKVFLINTDQKRQIQVYWFQIETNAKFGSEPKAKLALGSWVNAARVLWTVLSVSTTAQNNRDQRNTVRPPPSIQIPTISLFCKKPSSRKASTIYCLLQVLHHHSEELCCHFGVPVSRSISPLLYNHRYFSSCQ